VRPLGFEIDDTQLRRAGLDYHEYAPDAGPRRPGRGAGRHRRGERRAAARVRAEHPRHAVRYDSPALPPAMPSCSAGNPGLPQDVLDAIPDGQRLRLPMRPDNRSLNLSNAVAVVVFEAWRQAGFAGGA
jgi:tRNA (cytidine/uridine-2'-O-)-methyltransferase